MDCGETISYQALLSKVLQPSEEPNACNAIRVFAGTLDATADPVECNGKSFLELLWLTYDEGRRAIRVVESGGFNPLLDCDTSGTPLLSLGLDLLAYNTDGDLAIKVAYSGLAGLAPTCSDCSDPILPLETMFRNLVFFDLSERATLSTNYVSNSELDWNCDRPVPSFETAMHSVISSSGINVVFII